MHLSSPDELKLKIREMWMFLLSWNWASFISLVMLVWCHIISYTSNIFLSSLLIGKCQKLLTCGLKIIFWILRKSQCKVNYMLYSMEYIFLCMFHSSCNRFIYTLHLYPFKDTQIPRIQKRGHLFLLGLSAWYQVAVSLWYLSC